MLPSVSTVCELCAGKRFDASVLDDHLGGRDISEVLGMSVTEAEAFFGAGGSTNPGRARDPRPARRRRTRLRQPGQPLTTLSGGARQRLLAIQLAEKGDVYVLDEPTTGLHLAAVKQLLGLLDRLIDSGISVIVVEHHQAVMAHADWIIALVADGSTLTGHHLAEYVKDPKVG